MSGYATQAAIAVGMSVTTRSHRPDSSATSIAGADSIAGRMSASSICGRHVSYHTVACCEVHVAPARSEMPAASAYGPSAFTRPTIDA